MHFAGGRTWCQIMFFWFATPAGVFSLAALHVFPQLMRQFFQALGRLVKAGLAQMMDGFHDVAQLRRAFRFCWLPAASGGPSFGDMALELFGLLMTAGTMEFFDLMARFLQPPGIDTAGSGFFPALLFEQVLRLFGKLGRLSVAPCLLGIACAFRKFLRFDALPALRLFGMHR